MKTSLSVDKPALLCRLLHGRNNIANNTCSFPGLPAEGAGAGSIHAEHTLHPAHGAAALFVMPYFCTALPITTFSIADKHQAVNNFLPGKLSSKDAIRHVPVRIQA